MVSELLSCQSLDVDHLKFFVFELIFIIFFSVDQLVFEFSQPFLQSLVGASQVGVVLFVVLESFMELSLLVPQQLAGIPTFWLGGVLNSGDTKFGSLGGIERLSIFVDPGELFRFVDGNLVLKFSNGAFELLVFEF